MSDNLNRSTPDFSKYDSMSIGELEEILRADAVGPERGDSDVDEILYVMEVLAEKRRQNEITGKTALEAYQEFQQHYLPRVEKDEIGSAPKRKATVLPFRRIAAVAASLVLIFTLTTSANAFGWKDIWNAVSKWAEETFSFSMGVEVSEPKNTDESAYSSLQVALTENGHDLPLPTWVPDGFVLSDIIVDLKPKQETYIAIYQKDEHTLKVIVQSYFDGQAAYIEKSDDFKELYTVYDVDYHVFSNINQCKAAWIIDSYQCYITGEVSIEEIKTMIDSIKKG